MKSIIALILFSCVVAAYAQLPVGGTTQMTATCHYANGTSLPCNTKDAQGDMASWVSSDPAVAIISLGGLVTGDAAGLTSITANVGGLFVSNAIPITVTAPPVVTLTSVTLAAGSSTVRHGSETQLKATCHYSDGSSKTCPTVSSWAVQSTGTTAIATVSSNGFAYGITKGTARFIATVGTISSNAVPVVYN